MDQYLREYHVRRLLADIIPFEYNGRTYYISSPLAEFKFYAELVYKQVYEKSRPVNISADDVVVLLYRHNMWSEEDETNLDTFKKDLDKSKVNLYKNYADEDMRDGLKSVIRDLTDAISSLNHRRAAMNHLTAEHTAFVAKQRFLIGSSILKPNKKRLWNTMSGWDKDNSIIDAAFEKLNQNFLTERDIRDLVKNEPWKTVWSVSNKAQIVFRKAIKDLNDEQNNMVVWSIVYDNINKSQDAPTKDVIEDDDALDGWMIDQKRIKEAGEGKKEVASMIDKSMHKYEELFIIPKNESQIKKIQDMNDFAGKMAFKKKMMQIERDGYVDEVNMIDRREQIAMQASQLYAQGIRR